MAEVEVIQASDGPIVRDVRMVGMPLQVTRMRVAAYVRVSTDGEEKLQSFQSQKQYYQDKISQNKEWVMVGIYAEMKIPKVIQFEKVSPRQKARNKGF